MPVGSLRVLLRTGIACAAMMWVGVALATPGTDARARYQAAVQLVNTGNDDQALALIDEGLAAAPQDLPLLGLKGRVLLALRDYPGALATYEAYLAAGVTGANRRGAQQIVQRLSAVRTTFLDITVANGPATIYLDSRTEGVLCTTAPGCNRPILPGDYKVIAERPGFEVWTGRIAVPAGATTRLAIALVEKPSRLTVRIAQTGAQVMVDGATYRAPAEVAAGTHHVVVALAHHREAQRDVVAHEGKPVELDVALTPIVSVRVEPAGAALSLDGQPVALEDGGLAVPAGDHELVARSPGYLERRVQLPAIRPSDDELVIALERVPPPVAAAPVPPHISARRKVALTVGGLGVAAAVTGVVLGIQSGHLKDDAYALCPSPSISCSRAADADRSYDRGRSRAIAADIGFGVAGAAAITAAVLWFTGAPEARVAVRPRLGPAAGLDVAVRF